MRLARAATAFDKMECLNAYTGKLAFYGQLGLYDDTKRDSESGERRIISVAPGTTIPVRRVVSAADTKFIIGHSNPDSFRGRTIRVGYVAHEATYLSQIYTLGEFCRGESGRSAWAGRAWIKRSSDNEESSSLVPQHHIHYASMEPVKASMVVTFEGTLNVVRAVHLGPVGTKIAFVDEQPEPSTETATIETGDYDRVLETRSSGTAQVKILRARWQSLYEYKTHMAPKFGPTDIQVVMASSLITPKVGALMTLSDGTWQIESADLEGDVWICRAVLHA